MNNEQTLYRYWNAEELLYVGISINAYARAKKHRDKSKWWLDATHVTFERHPDRVSVMAAEKLAIQNEGPTYNIALKPKVRPVFTYIHPAPEPVVEEDLGPYTPNQVADIVRKHVETITAALRRGELHGTQSGKHSHWLIDDECIYPWMCGEPCPHGRGGRI